ncbi:MAG: MarR family transcriptional regulator [Fervidobacterium sp.]
MHIKGELTDSLVFQEVLKSPGLTISEIAERLGWTNGRVDGSVNRLILKKKVRVKHFIRRGMLVKKVYPLDYPDRTPEIIEIPKEMINYNVWGNSAFVYALSRSTIGISHKEIDEWNKKALFKESASLEKSYENIVIKLPEKFTEFYQLNNSDVSLSTIGNYVLITVESILPVKLPPIYPEEAKYEVVHYVMELKIEGISSNNPLIDYLNRKMQSSSQVIYGEPQIKNEMLEPLQRTFLRYTSR